MQSDAARPRRSRAWSVVFRAAYTFLRMIDPWLRAAWQLGGMGITARLSVQGLRSGQQRSVLVGLLRVEGRWYVGHPNGSAAWTRNLEAAGAAELRLWRGQPIHVRARRLDEGPERDAVIHAAANQQPFPGNLLYRAARRHILAVGTYFRLTPN